MKTLNKLSPVNQIVLKEELSRLKKINPDYKFIASELKKTFNAPINAEIAEEIDKSNFDAGLYESVLISKNLNLY